MFDFGVGIGLFCFDFWLEECEYLKFGILFLLKRKVRYRCLFVIGLYIVILNWFWLISFVMVLVFVWEWVFFLIDLGVVIVLIILFSFIIWVMGYEKMIYVLGGSFEVGMLWVEGCMFGFDILKISYCCREFRLFLLLDF